MEAAKRKPAGMTDGRSNQEAPARCYLWQDNRAGADTQKAVALCVSDSTTRPPEKKGGFCMKENQMKARLMEAYSRQDWKGIVETMAQNPGDKGDVVSMLDSYGENVDYEESGKAAE